MTAVTERPMLRWSSTRDCARKAIFEATGAPARDRTDKEQRTLFRGKRIGRDYAELLSLNHNTRDDHRKFIRAQHRSIEKGGGYYGAGKVWCEKKIVWPLGVGHADIWLPQSASVIEVLSSAHASDDNVRSKLLQLVGYMEHDPETEKGALVILNPLDMTEDRHLVSKRSETYKGLVEEMHERIRQVQAWDETGTLPPRVCRKPGDAWGHFCVFAEHCFEGWQAPERPVVDDPKAIELARRWVELKRVEETTVEQKIAAKERKEVEAELADRLPVGTVAVGPYEATRTHIDRKPSFEWEKAELAGMVDQEALAEFFKPGASYDTWKVQRVTPEFLDEALTGRVTVEDFGDEAPF